MLDLVAPATKQCCDGVGTRNLSKDLTISPAPSSSRGVRCTRCGRENSVGLRFCQDCGCRLDQGNESPEQSGPPHARPAAPSVGFAPRAAQPVSHCMSCGHAAAPGDAYCAECGAPLAAEQSPMLEAARRSLPPVTPRDASDPRTVVCAQCQNQNGLTDTYCNHCGAQLGDKVPNRPLDAPTQAIAAATAPGQQEASSTQRPKELAAALKRAPAGPCLLVVAQDGTTGRCYPIELEQTDIGRAEGEIVLPDDRFVCPRHARILRDGDKVTIQDLASVNGIYKRVRNPVKLQHGDVFLLGLGVLRFEALAPGEQQLSSAVDRGTQVFGSPASPRYARLSELTMEGVARSIFILTREETILGREVGDIVFSSDPFMSRRHAAITRSSPDGSFTLLDLGSSNGTFIRIRGQAELVPGDHVRVGQHLFRYDLNNGQVQGLEQAQPR